MEYHPPSPQLSVASSGIAFTNYVQMDGVSIACSYLFLQEFVISLLYEFIQRPT